jgi:hypothetical protein
MFQITVSYVTTFSFFIQKIFSFFFVLRETKKRKNKILLVVLLHSCRMSASQVVSILPHMDNFNDDIITFNIGGQIYSTTRSIINENVDSQSFLALVISNRIRIQLDNDGRYFIDRDGKYFRYILNYFRIEEIVLPENFNELKEFLFEVKFYQIDQLINEIENYLNRTNEKIKQLDNGFSFTLISNLNQNTKLIGPLKLVSLFHIQLIGKKFFSIISSYNDLQMISCQFTFLFVENLIRCQPLDQLYQFVLAAQAKKMGLIVSYCDDCFYIPVERQIILRDELARLILNKHNGKLLHTNENSCTLVEKWFLPTNYAEMYSNGSMTNVQ